jgi:hypothetical protein
MILHESSDAGGQRIVQEEDCSSGSEEWNTILWRLGLFVLERMKML